MAVTIARHPMRHAVSCPSVKAPDTVCEFTSGKSDPTPIGLKLPNIEAERPMIVRVFDLDVRFIGTTPFVTRDVDALDQKSLPIDALTHVPPVCCSHLGTHVSKACNKQAAGVLPPETSTDRPTPHVEFRPVVNEDGHLRKLTARHPHGPRSEAFGILQRTFRRLCRLSAQ